jgi:mono/diheme cytochrome c family protein
LPIPVTAELLARGQERYAIHCQVCHGAAGDGNGITSKFGMVGAANYHVDRLRQMADGEIYNTIVNGKNNMFGYGANIRGDDRWAIVAYVRALQRSQYATLADVPEEKKAELKTK